MNNYYTTEKNVQILLALLKDNNIKYVVASPGTTNIAFVGSVQNDPFFIVYSAPDERSAAYIACGIATEKGETVVLSCTGATASRNYMSGLTEAFYRKLPIIAVTSTMNICRSGHLFAQFVDRTQQPKDVIRYSAQIPSITKEEDSWECCVKINNAILETKRGGGGPVHLNIAISSEINDFSIKELPQVRKINRISLEDKFPLLPSGKIAIFIGSHKMFSDFESEVIDAFCSRCNAVVFCDHTSGYYGKFAVHYALAAVQPVLDDNLAPDLLIHLGETSGDYYTMPRLKASTVVWRVSEDGEIRDYFKKLVSVFEMSPCAFFSHYNANIELEEFRDEYLKKCNSRLLKLRDSIPELPFSNIWMAKTLSSKLPEGSTIHFGILNSLRSWNYFEIPEGVVSCCNVGGFGIDGNISTLVGASFTNKDKLYFAVVGDLSFFYDMNVLGNRHVGKNLRILLVNNGKGVEFRNYSHPAAKLGDRADEYIAAGGHYGNKSKQLVKHYAEDLGFEYYAASTKEEFKSVFDKLLIPIDHNKSIILEVFTKSEDESAALKIMNELEVEKSAILKGKIKDGIKTIIGKL